MEVILLERVEKLGQMGDVVSVKPGYARNYLLPRKKALRATKDNIAHFETQRGQFDAANLQKRDEAESIASKLDGLSIVLVRQASDSDQLYGSVTTRDISAEITEAGFSIEKNQVRLDHPIKTVGLHSITVRLHPEVSVSVTANVARTIDEAESQARGERPGMADDDNADVFGGGAEPMEIPEDAELPAAAQAMLDQPAEDDAAAPEAEPDQEQPDA
jgi:large subunit ribosomal protein L9